MKANVWMTPATRLEGETRRIHPGETRLVSQETGLDTSGPLCGRRFCPSWANKDSHQWCRSSTPNGVIFNQSYEAPAAASPKKTSHQSRTAPGEYLPLSKPTSEQISRQRAPFVNLLPLGPSSTRLMRVIPSRTGIAAEPDPGEREPPGGPRPKA